MAELIQMIALSPTMNEGTIAQWLVSEGQDIKSGAALCEVETDKATMTYESPVSAKILKILLPAGSSATVGQAIAVAGKAGEDWHGLLPSEPGTQAALPELAPAPPAPVRTAPTQPVPAGPPPAAPLTPSPPAAYVSPAPITPGMITPPLLPSGNPASSPLARKLARQAGLDLRALTGSGPNGRIIARDVQAARPATAPSATIPAQSTQADTPAGQAKLLRASGSRAKGLRSDAEPVSKIRGIIAQRLGDSYRQAPHYLVRMAIDMERLQGLRRSVNSNRETKLSLNAFILRIVARALEDHPVINSSWRESSIQYRGSADLALAVAVQGGLITPVVRSCEKKGITEIDSELSDLVARARNNTLAPEEYTDASFTISNLGAYGVEEFSAIINPPGVAILALGAIRDEAVVRDREICVRPILHATLSADHRAVDGAVAAEFMQTLKRLLEEPVLALL